jgi:arsenate reductase (thioredoxin)
MAEAFLNELCPNDFAAESSGLEPGTLNPLPVEAVRDAGLDISHKATKSDFDLFEAGKRYSHVITVCDETSAERCPIFPGDPTRLHWSFPDPAGFDGSRAERLVMTRLVRNQIRNKILEWCDEMRETCETGALRA